MRRLPHENVATVLVAPGVQHELELDLMARDLWMWPVATAPICVDGPRRAFQIRRRMIMAQRGDWDDAVDWTPVWISFGESWHDGDEPLPWPAHRALWKTLETYAGQVHYHRGLGGVAPLAAPREVSDLPDPARRDSG